MKLFLFILTVCVAFACGPSDTDNSTAVGKNVADSARIEPDQLNITLLLDLSDRIDTTTHPEKPEHFERDISIVRYFAELFVKDMKKRGTYLAKGKIKVIFSPKPLDPNINLLAEKLSVDLSVLDIKSKKEIHDNLVGTFTDNITKIYSTTLSHSKWNGSDIWRFFKNDVKDYCIDYNPGYRNILVLLTDGYIYHQDSRDKAGNRYAYLLPEIISKYNLRRSADWEQEIEKQDFGIISKRNDLENLEVLVLEISPSPMFKNDEDIIKVVLAKWFKEMKVKRYGMFNSDLPEYTKQRINDFVK
ncbi:MAG: hypothetical protein WCF67_21580 [Chitinophagaceae bacterium]